MKTYAILNDIQIPWQDKRALALACDIVLDRKPDGVILNGDIVDCYAISDFNKNPDRIKSWGLKREIAEAGALMKLFRNVPSKRWLDGNHEDRWRRVQWQFPNLQGMLKNFADAFHMEDHGFTWAPYGDIINLGKLIVTHGSVVSKHSGMTAKAHCEKFGGSCIVGHSHRMGTYYYTNAKGVHGGWDNGCLCRLDPEYVQYPNWQQGFSFVNVFENGYFNVQPIPIIARARAFYGAREYKVA